MFLAEVTCPILRTIRALPVGAVMERMDGLTGLLINEILVPISDMSMGLHGIG